MKEIRGTANESCTPFPHKKVHLPMYFLENGGQRRIRTFVHLREQIYSLPPLTTRPPTLIKLFIHRLLVSSNGAPQLIQLWAGSSYVSVHTLTSEK